MTMMTEESIRLQLVGMDESRASSTSATSDADAGGPWRWPFGGNSNNKTDLAKRETRAVLNLRAVVLLVLLLVAIGVTMLMWFTTSQAEQEDFETNFVGAASKLILAFDDIVEQKLNAIAGFGVSLTSYARDNNNDNNNETTWPFVTMNDFQQRADSCRALSDALFLNVVPKVAPDQLDQWQDYAFAHKGWVQQGQDYQRQIGWEHITKLPQQQHQELLQQTTQQQQRQQGPNNGTEVKFIGGVADKVWFYNETWDPAPDPMVTDSLYPLWQSSPLIVVPEMTVNFNIAHYPPYAPYIRQAMETGQITFGGILMAPPGNVSYPHLTTSFNAFILSYAAGKLVDYQGDPFSSVFVPVFDGYEHGRKQQKVVGAVFGVIQWAAYFDNVLPTNSPPVTVVLENSCEGPFTYQVSPSAVHFVGPGDSHDVRYNRLAQTASFRDLIHDDDKQRNSTTTTRINMPSLNEDLCSYSMTVYATQAFEDEYTSTLPIIITISVGAAFLFAVLLFLLYDRLVEQRQTLVMDTAEHTTAIVSSLFPAQIKDRLLEESRTSMLRSSSKTLSTSTITAGGGGGLIRVEKPLADLFLETTVMFADVSGFTSWSSVREPSQIFMLLEACYQEFDKIAMRRRIFKVETVGDCYVAAAGLPEPRHDHAVVMAKYSDNIIAKMGTLTKELEVLLGPDTAELGLRVGINSGPVTGGILRGERARFQLFGTTVNTASRIETSGLPGRIHCSARTAELLMQAGKGSWLQKRQEPINAKGLGCIETFWVQVQSSGSQSQALSICTSNSSASEDVVVPGFSDRIGRLIKWNTEILTSLLRAIVAQRVELEEAPGTTSWETTFSGIPLGEVREIVSLPDFDAEMASNFKNPDEVIIPQDVVAEIEHLVATIASMYRHNNPFHNFEHASHVLMSVNKTLARIIAPSAATSNDLMQDDSKVAEFLHDHTYGIAGDPLTRFACAFSALCHDVDHTGVSNAQLVIEGAPIADRYDCRSVAEQHSLVLSWAVLMRPDYASLRSLLFSTADDFHRFRQLVVNSVMATDIADAELKALRNDRWDRAFTSEVANSLKESPRDSTNRKATIVIEHIIQASDISHTMQHWHVYRKWNTKLFEELYVAYLNGRMEKDPAEFWFKGEIGFFDFYIIPLTKKLKDCGVFGVSSGEFLNYAGSNRAEWIEKGEACTAELVQLVREKYGEKKTNVTESLETATLEQASSHHDPADALESAWSDEQEDADDENLE
ncbi:Receptor-type guanylate cyclase gcy [Seminavis robusta]|uniref:Receptor-type guanylate cyclase gcy n=1 Tax=Seminavis robusta TaxID=568900 RepID=A0A9N8HK15_9STRA|nr:Receptor-type guanylate cyclase gcy [Seminavis robusta]|eukprot:Sro804_g204860.1 Receptor-type guanylate cyclase gcy (1235) ;mRNA; r:3299-8803